MREGEFTPLIPLFPLPQTEKEIWKFFKTSFLVRKQKKKNTSANSVYLATSFIQKSLHPYFASLRSAKHQIYANVKWNWLNGLANSIANSIKSSILKSKFIACQLHLTRNIRFREKKLKNIFYERLYYFSQISRWHSATLLLLQRLSDSMKNFLQFHPCIPLVISNLDFRCLGQLRFSGQTKWLTPKRIRTDLKSSFR